MDPKAKKNNKDGKLSSAIHNIRTKNMKQKSLDADEDLLKRLGELQEKLKHVEMKK